MSFFLPYYKKIKSWLSLPLSQVITVFLFLLVARFWPFLQGKTLFFGDNYSLMIPGKLFTAHWLKQGVLPLWNPTIFTGISWIGDVNQSIFYPSTLFFMWLNSAQALNLTLMLHLALTFIGMYLVTKKVIKNHYSALFASVIWTASTQITAVMNNISTLQSLSWLPLVVYTGLSINKSFKHRFLFAVTVFFQFAGGYPSHVFYSILLAVIISFLEKEKPLFSKRSLKVWFWHWLQTGVLTVALSAVIWLPFIEVLQNSTRIIQTSDQAISGSLHPLETIKLFLPYFFDHPVAGIKWGPSWNSMPNVAMYFSWLGLLILFRFILNKKKNKKEMIWLFLFLLFFLFSFGGYLPLNLSFLTGPSRGPSTALIISCFFVAIIIGKYFTSFKVSKTYFLVGSVILFIASVSYLIIQTNFYFIWQLVNDLLNSRLLLSPFHTIEKNRVIAQNIICNLLINGSFFLVITYFLKKKLYFFCVLLLSLDLIFNTQGILFFAPAKVYPQLSSELVFQERVNSDPQARTLIRNYNAPYTGFGAYWEAIAVRQPFSDSYVDQKELTEFNHLTRMSSGMTPDWNMVANTKVLNGYTTLMPLTVNDVWHNSDVPAINNLSEIKLDNELLPDWSVKYYLVDQWFRGQQAFADLNLIATQDHWALYELPALPRFRLADGALANQAPKNLIINEDPNKIELQFINESDANQLIIADRYDKNWQAEVNGEEIEVLAVNQMRQISIKPGKNSIKLWYHPRFFYLGGMTSISTGFASAVILIVSRLKKNKLETTHN